MKREYSSRNRKELKLKMATVFGKKMQTLSEEMQGILLDDLVTAFENRLNVLSRAHSTIEFEIAEGVKCETIKA